MRSFARNVRKKNNSDSETMMMREKKKENVFVFENEETRRGERRKYETKKL